MLCLQSSQYLILVFLRALWSIYTTTLCKPGSSFGSRVSIHNKRDQDLVFGCAIFFGHAAPFLGGMGGNILGVACFSHPWGSPPGGCFGESDEQDASQDTTGNTLTARLRHRKPYFGVSSSYPQGYSRGVRSSSTSLVLRNVRPEGANEAGLLSRLASKPPSCEQDAGHSQARPHPARLPSVGPVDPPSPRLTILSLLLTITSVAVLNGWRRVDPFPTPTLAMLLHIREHRGRAQGGAPPLIACRLATLLSSLPVLPPIPSIQTSIPV